MSAAVSGAGDYGRTTAGTSDRADLGAWLGVAAGSLGSLMATLDISIVNSALPVIQGEIGATASEGTWIATAYLVAEIVMIPLTGWLERLLGLRRFLLISAVLFTLFSVICGYATTLLVMIIGRVGQGFAGGAMIPTAMTTIATRLPPRQQPIGTALFGATVIMGPVLGPLCGGWLTENLSWHYAFFINVPACAVLIALLLLGLPDRPMQLKWLREADWAGIVGMMLSLGSLTVMLEEGHREGWFDSALIRNLAVAMLMGCALVALGQMRAPRPVIRLALLRSRAMASVVIMVLAMGGVLFGSAFLIPQFLVGVAGYNALQSGYVVVLTGVPTILMMPVLPMLIARADVRAMVIFGFACLALACWLERNLTSASGAEAFFAGQLLCGVGQSLCLMFLNQSAITAVGPDEAGDAASLFNAARNLGGSICLAGLASLQDDRIEFHRWTLHSALSANDATVQDWVAGLGTIGAPYQIIDSAITQQAAVMAFSDGFVVLALAALAVAPLALLLQPLPKGTSLMAMH